MKQLRDQQNKQAALKDVSKSPRLRSISRSKDDKSDDKKEEKKAGESKEGEDVKDKSVDGGDKDAKKDDSKNEKGDRKPSKDRTVSYYNILFFKNQNYFWLVYKICYH